MIFSIKRFPSRIRPLSGLYTVTESLKSMPLSYFLSETRISIFPITQRYKPIPKSSIIISFR